MTMPDLPVEGLRPWPGTSAHQFDSAGLTEAHRHWRCRGRILDQKLHKLQSDRSEPKPAPGLDRTG